MLNGLSPVDLLWRVVDMTVLLTIPIPELTRTEWLRKNAAGAIRPGLEWQRFREQMQYYFASADVDQDGFVTAEDLNSLRTTAWSHLRLTYLDQLREFDRRGDGYLSPDDLQIVNRRYPGVWADSDVANRSVGRVAILDLADELVRSEINTFTMGRPHERDSYLAQARLQGVVLTSLDQDGDGVVSMEEYVAMLRAYFNRIDIDKDGFISISEALAHYDSETALESLAKLTRANIARLAEEVGRARRECNINAVDPASRLVELSTRYGTLQSTLAVGGFDLPVRVADVEVENGSEKITLVLRSTCPTVWRISGATTRIHRLLIFCSHEQCDESSVEGQTKGLRAGVQGIEKEKITFIPTRYFAGASRAADPTSKAEIHDRLETFLGRRFDGRFELRDVKKVLVPSGDHRTEPPAGEQWLGAMLRPDSSIFWLMALEESPYGFADLDAGTIVSEASLARFPVLPGAAGLAQLIDAGALELISAATQTRRGNITIQDGTWQFRFLKKAVIPSLMHFSSFVFSDSRFYVARGVDWPSLDRNWRSAILKGKCKKPTVISEETGQEMPL